MKVATRRRLRAGGIGTALLTILLTSAQAQQGPATIRLQPEDLERGQYNIQHNFFFLPPGKTREEDYVSAGFFGQKLRPYLGSNQQALAELDKYKRQKTLFLIDRVVLVGSAGLYASQVFAASDKDVQFANPTQLVAGGLFVGSLLATLLINRNTNEYIKQAIDNYNSDVPTGRRGSFRLRRPSAIGLAATPQGQPLLTLGWRL